MSLFEASGRGSLEAAGGEKDRQKEGSRGSRGAKDRQMEGPGGAKNRQKVGSRGPGGAKADKRDDLEVQRTDKREDPKEQY